MTPAVQELRRAGVDHTLHEYERGDELHDFGREAAEALGLPEEQVFKTLVLDVDGGLAVAVVPVGRTVSMKRAAAALGGKRAALATRHVAERSTGYVLGGISPFGQRRRLPTVLDSSAHDHATVFVSAGKRGVDVGVAPDDVVAVLDAITAHIVAD